MRIPSGKIDQNIYFVAVDSNDLKTRKTGLSSFTVYRSRNGAAPVAYTTPTIAELDATHMPGVYALLIDEDSTIASTSDSEEYTVHITCSGMAPVTRSVELFRRAATSGKTITVDASGNITPADGSITAAKLATDAITAAKIATDAGSEIAQAVLSEPIDNAESAATAKSLLWFLALVLNKSDVGSTHAGKLTVFKTDNSAELFTQTVTQTSVNPITSKAEAS